MNNDVTWNQGADPQSLAENLAGELVLKIGEAIAKRGKAVIAFSGGSTPKPLFQALAQHDVDWSKLVITLVDERWVPATHELSNAAFIRKHFFDLLPIEVTFIDLYQPAQTVEASYPLVLDQYCSATDSTVDNLRAFDVVVLGMGDDGHTASFFPDADNIAQLVSYKTEQQLLTCHSKNSQVERITWSLSSLLNTDFLALHFIGEKKRKVFEIAAEGGSAEELPIRAAIFQSQAPLHVYYAD